MVVGILFYVTLLLSYWGWAGTVIQPPNAPAEASSVHQTLRDVGRIIGNGLRRITPRKLVTSVYFAIATYCAILLFTPPEHHMGPIPASAWENSAYLSIMALIYFFTCCTVVLRHNTRGSNEISALEVFFTVGLGILGCIAVFALIYRQIGINGPFWDESRFPQLRYAYYSAVTFSTLGYGDFSPTPASSFFAALQAILGNMHLALLVGALFGVNAAPAQDSETTETPPDTE